MRTIGEGFKPPVALMNSSITVITDFRLRKNQTSIFKSKSGLEKAFLKVGMGAKSAGMTGVKETFFLCYRTFKSVPFPSIPMHILSAGGEWKICLCLSA